MRSRRPTLTCDLVVIGTGMTGMAAGLFAAEHGIDTIQVGMTAELNYASGFLDLMGVHPVDEGRQWDNPWQAISALSDDCPAHPYARLEPNDIEAAIASLLGFLERHGLPYYRNPQKNLRVMTPVGTLKSTYAAPYSTYHGIEALKTKGPCLIADFKGLKGFSATQIAQSLKPHWPQLNACRLAFPDAVPGDLYPELMAQRLELPKNRKGVVEAIRPHLSGTKYIALPAVLGLYRANEVLEDFQRQLVPCRLFEIPTMPPSITGLRLRHVFEQNLAGYGVRRFTQHKVLHVENKNRHRFVFEIGYEHPETIVHAKGAILASGRFFGQGLRAGRHLIQETVFGLPVYQPHCRADWHSKTLLCPNGHAINRAGIETDEHFRPVDQNGRVIYPNLFAAGSILARQDWVRQKCGSGLAISTAYGAVKQFMRCR